MIKTRPIGIKPNGGYQTKNNHNNNNKKNKNPTSHPKPTITTYRTKKEQAGKWQVTQNKSKEVENYVELKKYIEFAINVKS